MKTIGAIDIGTNSIRLAVAKVDQSHSYHLVLVQKEVIRLGEGEFAHNKITRAAMERGLLVLRRFVEIASRHGAQEITVVATAAVREAQNKQEFVDRARDEAGVEVKVVSGLEEARLIYLGISSGSDLADKNGLFIDIGGGTTELILGDKMDYRYLDSVKLGAIRLKDMFLSGNTGPVTPRKFSEMLDYIRGASSNATRKITEMGFDAAYGSSGTIINLGEITAKRVSPGINNIRNYLLKYSDLVETTAMLCSLSVDERRNVPGINPERADIIVSGAAILQGVMSGVGADSIRISDRALRDGIVIDYIFQEDLVKEEFLATSPRLRSIMQLCRSCNYEEKHAAKVTELARLIFAQLRDLGVHSYGKREEELLRYASLVHDVGTFISMADHHKHSHYLIKNWGLLGFDSEEVEIIAASALCHRKQSPKKSAGMSLSPAHRRLVEVIASVLRVADALDRSQLGYVREVILRWIKAPSKMVIEIYCGEDCPLEMWSLEEKKILFENTFEVDLSIKRISG